LIFGFLAIVEASQSLWSSPLAVNESTLHLFLFIHFAQTWSISQVLSQRKQGYKNADAAHPRVGVKW